MPKSTIVSLLLLVVLAIACAPIGAPSDPSRQQQVEQYASELPWPVLDHATFVVHSTQDGNFSAYSDCPTRTIHVYPSAFNGNGERTRWIVAHESGHQRDCDGLPGEFYTMITEYGAFTPHTQSWDVAEGLADCMAEYWLGYTLAGYWDCPDKIVARIPEWAPN